MPEICRFPLVVLKHVVETVMASAGLTITNDFWCQADSGRDMRKRCLVAVPDVWTPVCTTTDLCSAKWYFRLHKDGYAEVKMEFGKEGKRQMGFNKLRFFSLGEWEEGLDSSHLCANKACVLYAHLVMESRSVNVTRDRKRRKEDRAKKEKENEEKEKEKKKEKKKKKDKGMDAAPAGSSRSASNMK
jgi:hypothetical protein